MKDFHFPRAHFYFTFFFLHIHPCCSELQNNNKEHFFLIVGNFSGNFFLASSRFKRLNFLIHQNRLKKSFQDLSDSFIVFSLLSFLLLSFFECLQKIFPHFFLVMKAKYLRIKSCVCLLTKRFTSPVRYLLRWYRIINWY